MAWLVTGGTGYMGSGTVPQLVNRGEEVVVLQTAITRRRIEDLERKLNILRGDLDNFNDGFVKSPFCSIAVIPAKAGIQ